MFRQIVCYLAELFRQIACYLAELFRQIVCYLAELFRQIAFPNFFHEIVEGGGESSREREDHVLQWKLLPSEKNPLSYLYGAGNSNGIGLSGENDNIGWQAWPELCQSQVKLILSLKRSF